METDINSTPAKQAADQPFGQQGGNGGNLTHCPNCGADFPIEAPCCPYCEALNPYGAEKAYMGALADLRDETDNLDDDARANFKNDLKRNTKRTVVIAVIVVAALAALLFAFNCMGKHDERQALQEYQAREAFREQYFEEFDRLYEAGDDEALSDYVWSLMDDPGFDALFSWKHVGLLEAHDDWEGLRSAEELIKSGECGIDDYTWAVSTALRLAQFDANGGTVSATLPQDEEERAADYRAYAHRFLQNVLQMDDEEIAAFTDDAKDELGYVQEEKLQRNLEMRLQQLGTPY